MAAKKKYDSVTGMVRATADSPEFSVELEKRLCDRQMIKQLLILRAGSGVTQEDLAAAMKCSQSRVSKLEAGTDAHLRFGDLVRYSTAVGYQMHIVFFKKDATLTDKVKFYFFQIKDILGKLIGLSKKDDDIATGVAQFLNDGMFNFIGLLIDHAKQLPADSCKGLPLVTMAHEPFPGGTPTLVRDMETSDEPLTITSRPAHA